MNDLFEALGSLTTGLKNRSYGPKIQLAEVGGVLFNDHSSGSTWVGDETRSSHIIKLNI
jgi:hypothetical protein